jgi:hypothetical protein
MIFVNNNLFLGMPGKLYGKPFFLLDVPIALILSQKSVLAKKWREPMFSLLRVMLPVAIGI